MTCSAAQTSARCILNNAREDSVIGAATTPLIDAEADSLPPPEPCLLPAQAGLLLGANLLLVALNLRPTVTSVGAVLPELVQGTGLSPLGASALTTLPVLCFGLFGPLGPGLARRLGAERTILVAIALLVVGAALRAVATAPAIFVGQTLAALAIGISNVLLPGMVKRHFPHRLPLMTGLYTMALCIGAAAGAGATLPLAHALGDSWSRGLGFWALPALLATVAWISQVPCRRGAVAHAAYKVVGLWRDPLAWQVTLFMGLQSSLAFTVFGWFPPILRDRGLSAVNAGLAVSISVLVQAAAALLAPIIAARGKDQRGSCVAAVALCIAGLFGCLYAPLWSVWFWSVVLGIAQGSLFALALTLIVMRAADAHVAAHLSSMAQGVGYIVAAAGPLLTGLLRAWYPGWTAVAFLCLTIAIAAALCALGAGRALHVQARSIRLPD